MSKLSPVQEEFLTKLFDLCNQYSRTANTECSSSGVRNDVFEVTIRLHVEALESKSVCTFTGG